MENFHLFKQGRDAQPDLRCLETNGSFLPTGGAKHQQTQQLISG